MLSSARITAHRNLVKGDYAIIIIDDELRVGQGIWKLSLSDICGRVSHFCSILSAPEARYLPHSGHMILALKRLDTYSGQIFENLTRLDKIRTDFAKIGTDRNSEIGVYGIYYFAGLAGSW